MNTGERLILVLVRLGVLVVDPDGRIWRLQTRGRTGKLRAIEPSRAEQQRPDGYWRARISVGGRDFSASSHRIVWMLSNGPIPNGREINHRDGDRGNNAPSNLETATKSENLAHSYRELGRPRLSGERNPRGRLRSSQVAEIRRLSGAGHSNAALGRQFGVTRRSIRLIVTGHTWRDEYPRGPEGGAA